jgi:hypothetical protein
VSSDNGDPALDSITISPSAVDTTAKPEQVQIAAVAHDTGGPGPAVGMSHFEVVVNRHPGRGTRVLMSPAGSNNWTGTFTVGKWARPGTWRIRSVSMRDLIGHRMEYAGPRSARPLNQVPGDHSFTVTSTSDPTPAELTAFSFSPTRVDTTRRPRFVRVAVRALDDQSGISRVRVLAGPGWSSAAGTQLRKVRGTPHTYRGRLSIRRFVETGRWGVWATVRNGADRGASFEPLGAARFLDVRSGSDTRRPTLTAIRIRPGNVDVRQADGSVTVTVRARDAGSGIADVGVDFRDPGNIWVPMRLVSGTRRDGVWRGSGIVPRCPAQSGLLTASVTLIDKSFNYRRWSKAKLLELQWPNTLMLQAPPDAVPPRVRIVGDRPTPTVPVFGPVVLRFNEPVNGINNASVQVRSSRSNPMTAGTWTCTDQSGFNTDCANGLVRRAAFTPDNPFLQSDFSDFSVLLNPEHNLDITDLAGNPCHRDSLHFQVAATPPARAMAPPASSQGCDDVL